MLLGAFAVINIKFSLEQKLQNYYKIDLNE